LLEIKVEPQTIIVKAANKYPKSDSFCFIEHVSDHNEF